MCRVEDSGKTVDGFFVLGASGRLPRASITAMLCLLLKHLRGLATFSLFHILFSAKIILSSERTNCYTVFDITYVHWCCELIPARFIHTIWIIEDEEAASALYDGRELRTC